MGHAFIRTEQVAIVTDVVRMVLSPIRVTPIRGFCFYRL